MLYIYIIEFLFGMPGSYNGSITSPSYRTCTDSKQHAGLVVLFNINISSVMAGHASKIRYLNRSDNINIRISDYRIKNKFNWSWLEEIIEVVVPDSKGGGKTAINIKLGDTIKKIDEPGQAYCEICMLVVSYGTTGKLMTFSYSYLI